MSFRVGSFIDHHICNTCNSNCYSNTVSAFIKKIAGTIKRQKLDEISSHRSLSIFEAPQNEFKLGTWSYLRRNWMDLKVARLSIIYGLPNSFDKRKNITFFARGTFNTNQIKWLHFQIARRLSDGEINRFLVKQLAGKNRKLIKQRYLK